MFGAGMNVFAVWNWVLATKDQDGLVNINPPAVAVTLGGTIEEVQAALDYLTDTDENSRSDAEDGRRLLRIKGPCYKVVNHAHYAKLRSAEERRAYKREWARENRRKKAGLDTASTPVDTASTESGQAGTVSTNKHVDKHEHVQADLVGVPAKPAPPTEPTGADAVWARLNELRKSLNPKLRSPKMSKSLRSSVERRIEESSVEDALDVLEHLAAECRRNPRQQKHFQGSTIFRPQNYARTLGQLGTSDARGCPEIDLDDFDPVLARQQLDALTGPV